MYVNYLWKGEELPKLSRESYRQIIYSCNLPRCQRVCPLFHSIDFDSSRLMPPAEAGSYILFLFTHGSRRRLEEFRRLGFS